MPGVLPRPSGDCSCSWCYSKNQTAIFAPLTRVNRPHHHARGFDHARELDRPRHSELMGHPVRNRTDVYCSYSVINRGQSRQNMPADGPGVLVISDVPDPNAAGRDFWHCCSDQYPGALRVQCRP